METWTVLRVLEWTTKRFGDANIEGNRLEAQVLIAHALGCTRIQLYTGFDKPLAAEELAACRALIKRRLAGEPLAYLVGSQEFWGQALCVSSAVLIPRADTETLIEVVIARRPERSTVARMLELCTGSGAIAVALAKEYPTAEIVATELSPAAAQLARQNLAAYEARVQVIEADLWPPPGALVDVVVANPPYIRSAELGALQAEVQHEPRLALDGGADGLVFYRRILAGLRDFAKPGALLAVEHGYDQGDAVQALFRQAGLVDVELTHDLGKQPRVVSGMLPA